MGIKIKNISKSFGPKVVIDNLSLEIEEGKVTVLMGPSGGGKTTLAHIILGILKPDQGTVEGLLGKSIAAVFQEDRLCEQLTAVKNVQLVLRKEKPVTEIINEFTQVGLTGESIAKPVNQLSGGQKRRVAILRAIMADRDFICLDEPFKGMDKETKANTMEYVKTHITGKTVLLITHDEEEAILGSH